MPYCPDCDAEYEIGMTSCPACGQELVDDSEEGEEITDEEITFDEDVKAILLYESNNVINVELLEGALKDQGIPCLVKSNIGSYSGLSSLTAVYKDAKIFVPESVLERAVEVAETIIPDYERPDD